MRRRELKELNRLVNRLRELLRKDYVLEELLKDPVYRRKLFIVAGLLGLEDVLLNQASLKQSGGAYQGAS